MPASDPILRPLDTDALRRASAASAANHDAAWNAAVEAAEAVVAKLALRHWSESQRLMRAGSKLGARHEFALNRGAKEALDAIRALRRETPDAHA